MRNYPPLSSAEEYCMYLRKSRVDIEAEAHGEGETLARHEKLLLEVARRDKLNVTQIYREVVSGETIASRPVMQHLLQEVEQGRWAGVLVVEVERLARGDTIDQGIMAQTFKYSGTKIVTPLKVYDPNNEYDEEYFEFGLFMSRREYKPSTDACSGAALPPPKRVSGSPAWPPTATRKSGCRTIRAGRCARSKPRLILSASSSGSTPPARRPGTAR